MMSLFFIWGSVLNLFSIRSRFQLLQYQSLRSLRHLPLHNGFLLIQFFSMFPFDPSRSSCSQVFFKIGVLKISQYSHENTFVGDSF